MRYYYYVIIGILLLVSLPGSARAVYFGNATTIGASSSNTIYHIADYYNSPALTFDGQPARMISLGGRFLHIEAGQALDAMVTNYSTSDRAFWLTNTTANPATEINASGLSAGYVVDVLANGAWVSQHTVNASGWVNFIFQNYAGAQTLVQFNQTAPPDTTPPTFDNLVNHTHTANTSFIYDVDATDPSGLGSFWINSTNFSIDPSTGVITNVTTLNHTRTEWINISVNDTVGNLAWDIFYINITKAVYGSALGVLEGKFYLDKWFIFTNTEMIRDTDSNMPANSLYYSLDRDKLVYKDPGGSVHELY